MPLAGMAGLQNYHESDLNYSSDKTDIKKTHMTNDNITKRQNRERGFWDSFAKKYDKFIDKNATSSYERLLKELKTDSNGANELLEIATGTGLLSIELQSLVKKITAIDISPEMIAIANQKLQDKQITNIEFKVGDSYQLDFSSDSSYDLLLA
jgi:ubiquinone/menaquinone biosynthesis C-methylase UbiE